jgi:hypothetical protein
VSITHTHYISVRSDNGSATVSGSQSEVGATELVISQQFAALSSGVAYAIAFTAANVQSIILKSDKNLTIYTNSAPVNAVQLVTITGSPGGGTFTLTYGGQTTSAIAYNAANTAVQSALQALSSIGSGNATVSGSAGGPYSVTFTGTLGGQPITLMTFSGAGLTGGSSPSLTIATTTTGVTGFYVSSTSAANLSGKILTS